MSYWNLDPIFGSYAVAAALTGALLIPLMVTPAFASATPTRRRVLLGLRLLSILLVLLAVLRPTWTTTRTRPQSSHLVFLWDHSRSMGIPDASDGQTRWLALRKSVESCLPELPPADDGLQVEFWQFDEQVHRLESAVFPDAPTGDQTDIGGALDEAIRERGAEHLSGVILLSDGAQRAYQPRAEAASAARELARYGYPLYTVTFGRGRDQTQARDVAVENFPDQYSVYVKNQLIVSADIRAQGFSGQPLTAQLTVRDEAGNEKVVDSAIVRATQDQQRLPVQLSYTPEQPGRFSVTVQVSQLPGELLLSNNQLTGFLHVKEGGLKVLYWESNLLHEEQKFLRRSLRAAEEFELVYQPLDRRSANAAPAAATGPSTEPRANPGNKRPAGTKDEPDVYIIGDVDTSLFGQQQLEQLAQQVADGKGLLMLGGYHTLGPGGYADSPLAPVLPIVMDRFERQPLSHSQPVRPDIEVTGPLTMLPTGDHFITRLAEGNENLALWQSLPPLRNANKLRELRRQDAIVLAETPDHTPLLIQGNYGLGRVLVFAGDSTYRWWRGGHPEAHKRFWRQAVLWLAGQEDLIGEQIAIELPKRRYFPGEPIPFSVQTHLEDSVPAGETSILAEIIDSTGKGIEIPSRVDGDNRYSGRIDQPLTAGTYHLKVTARHNGQSIATSQVALLVLDQDLELSDPAANPQQMGYLAAITKDAGGKSIAPEQLRDLVREIRDRPRDIETEVAQRWQLGDTGLDAGIFYGLLLAVLGLEWYLRKRWSMV